MRTVRRSRVGPAVGLVPFLAYVTIFLVVPTVTVAVGAVQDDDGRFTLDPFRTLGDDTVLRALRRSRSCRSRRPCSARCSARCSRT